jgi:chromosome partitioning protein
MKIIGIVHGKGGVGKSTIAVNVSRSLQLRGLDVAIIDCDAQGTSQDWKASGDSDRLPAVYAVGKPGALGSSVQQLDKAFDVAVIDGGGQLQQMHAEIIKTSDLVLIPVQPSPADIWPTEKIVELIRARQSVVGAPEAAFVVSRRKTGTRLGKGVQDILERFELPVWDGTCDRVAYPKAMGRGISVVEMDDAKAASEVEAISDNIIATLTRSEDT